MKGQLGKMEEQYATDLGTGYDYASIMHYAGRAKDFDFMFRKDTGLLLRHKAIVTLLCAVKDRGVHFDVPTFSNVL